MGKNSKAVHIFFLNHFLALVVLASAACDKSSFTGANKSGAKPENPQSAATSQVQTDGSQHTPVDDCYKLPLESQKIVTKSFGERFRNTLFHKVVGVDPGNTGKDPSSTMGQTPLAVSPSTELNRSEFILSPVQLKDLASAEGNEFEVMAFAHQFGSGLDRIYLEVNTGLETLSDTSPTNIYSAYGYISVKNFRVENGKIFGDIDIFSFNYHPKGVGPLYDKIRAAGQSPMDGTDISGPASEGTSPKVSKKNVELVSLAIRVAIDASLYDSVQYRALRVSTWSRQSMENVKICP